MSEPTQTAPLTEAPEDASNSGLMQTAKLLKLIHERGFMPGDRLPSERELSQMFTMSRNSLRESLVRLETLRIIEMRPKSGIYLRLDPAERSTEALVLFAETNMPLKAHEVSEAIEVRRIVEIQGLRLACERRTDSDLKNIWNILSHSQRSLLDGGNLVHHDPEFHLALLACTHNQMLMQIAHVFYAISKRRRQMYFSEPGQNERSHAQHMALFEALKNRDADLGVRLLENHLQGVNVYFEEFFHAAKTT